MSEFFMGCDVSKGYADFVILNKSKKVIENTLQFDDTAAGHAVVHDFICKFFSANPTATLYVGVESTGGYENNWFALFKRLGELFAIKVTRLNPLVIKAHHNASMKRNCTDGISAENIASYLVAYPELVNYEQDSTFSDLRKQWNFIELLKKQKTQLSNQLGFVLYQTHPELVRYCQDGIPEWILRLLEKYPTANNLSRARVAAVAKIPHIDEAKAKTLIDESKKSIASHCSESDGFVIQGLVNQIVSLDSTIEMHKKHLEKHCDIPEVKRLCTINGMGTYSAIGLMINIVSIARFSDVKKLSSYFGLHPIYRQSGDGVYGFHMSKKGRCGPRGTLYMVILSALNCNTLIRNLYEKHKSKGMKSMAAIGVCMHKMLRIVYGMLRNESDFNPDIDERNHKIIVRNNSNAHQIKKRRLQGHDNKAPISKRQSKKRKEMEQGSKPQRNDVSENGVNIALPLSKDNNRHTNPVDEFSAPVRIDTLIKNALENVNLIIQK